MEKENNIINNNSSISNISDYNNNNSIFSQAKNDINDKSNLEKEALILTKKADNKLNPGCCLDTLCISKTKRYSDACKLYKKAGDKYKICRQWRKAGECYEHCSKIKTNLKGDPLTFYQESFFCYSKVNNDNNSKKIFEKMNQYLERKGEYYQAGKNNENLAIKKENDEKYDEAINYYLQAFKYYETDGKHESLKNNMEIKITELMMVHNHPDGPKKVPAILENIGNNYLKNPLTNYSASDYFGKAVLSIIYYSNNPSEGRKYIKKYKDIDPIFEESTIYNLCCDVINYMENKDINNLKNAIKEYKEICEVDDFMIDILNKLVKKTENNNNISENKENDFNIEEEDLK